MFFYIYINHIKKTKLQNHVTKNIKKIIFRSHHKNEIPNSMFYNCHTKWIELNPEYSMLWFNDIQCENFMKKMGNKIFSSYKTLKPGAFKCDLWRACILYKYGGVYIDSYCSPYKSLEFMFSNCLENEKHKFISVRDKSGIHNGFIMCTKKHPFLKQYILDIIENVEKKYYGKNSLDPTGPLCLLKSINKINKNSIEKKPKLGLNLGIYNFYLFEHDGGLKQDIKKGKINLMRKKYSIISYFNQKFLNWNLCYGKMWNDRNIYN